MSVPTSLPTPRLQAVFCAGIASFLAASAMQSHAASIIYSQGFETDDSGWLDNDDLAGYGGVTRVATGTGGVASHGGDFHAQVTSLTTGPFTNFGGYSDTWPGNYVSQISIYIDPAQLGTNGGFSYSAAVNDQGGSHLRDYVFHVTNDSDTGTVLVNADSGTSFSPATDLESRNGTITLAQAGWYTFRQTFMDIAGVLSVQMQVLDSGNSTLFTTNLSNTGDLIGSVVGGNRYGWFTALSTNDPLAIDDASLSVIPEPSSAFLLIAGVASFGLRRRR